MRNQEARTHGAPIPPFQRSGYGRRASVPSVSGPITDAGPAVTVTSTTDVWSVAGHNAGSHGSVARQDCGRVSSRWKRPEDASTCVSEAGGTERIGHGRGSESDEQGGLEDQRHPLDDRTGPGLEGLGLGQVDMEVVNGPCQSGVPESARPTSDQ